MLERRNIARPEVLLDVADELAAEPGGFDAGRFRDDLAAARERGVGRFPPLTFRPRSDRSVMIVGYRPYDTLRAALARVSPDLVAGRLAPAADPVAYVAHWGSALDREVAEALGRPLDETRRGLDAAVAAGTLIRDGAPKHRYRAARSRPETSHP